MDERESTAAVYSRKNPYLAELARHELLTKPGSLKETRHFVLNLRGSGLSYTPGDSLGVFARNSPALVEELLTTLGFDGNHQVSRTNGQRGSLREALINDYTLNRANRKILVNMAERIPQGEQRNRLMEL
ncbi:MAG TPA: sulfite reductase subunit alpha, partial [Verrucomicrobiae bacterium]|nr:sulfite reductase subunit alpha [Verrucomicrobiae bacterium]